MTHSNMAGKSLSTDQIRKILELHRGGMSNRRIARAMEPPIGRACVNKYVNFVTYNGLNIQTLLDMDDVELDRIFHKGDPAYTEPKIEDFIKDIPYFEEERISRASVNQMWNNYMERNRGKECYSLTQFRYHLEQMGLLPITRHGELSPKARRSVSAIATTRSLPTSNIDFRTGEMRMVHLVALYMESSELIKSSYVDSLDINDVIPGVNRILSILGGEPTRLDTSDLLKVCTKPEDMKLTVKGVLKQMLWYYHIDGFKPQDGLPSAREHMEGAFNHLNHMITTAKDKTAYGVHATVELFMERYNRTRIHRRGLSREEDFIRNERPNLELNAPACYEPGEVSPHNVYLDGTIQVGKGSETGYYSVPESLISGSVKCIHGKEQILIMSDFRFIAAHQRVADYRYSLKDRHIKDWDELRSGVLQLCANAIGNISQPVAEWVGRFFQKLLGQGLHMQELVRKYDNIQRMTLKNPGLMADFCTTYHEADFESYRDFIRAFNSFSQGAIRGRELGRDLLTQK